MLDFHHEFKKIPALVTAEAIPKLLYWRDKKGRRFLLVKRTKPLPVRSRLRKLNVLFDVFGEIEFLLDFFGWGHEENISESRLIDNAGF